jgi:hypothetical protein
MPKKKGSGFPQQPFDMGRSGGEWVKSSRPTEPGSFKKGQKKGKKGK